MPLLLRMAAALLLFLLLLERLVVVDVLDGHGKFGLLGPERE